VGVLVVNRSVRSAVGVASAVAALSIVPSAAAAPPGRAHGPKADAPTQPLVTRSAPSRVHELPFGRATLTRSTAVAAAPGQDVRVTFEFDREPSAARLLVKLWRPSLPDSPTTGRNIDAFSAPVETLDLSGVSAGSRRSLSLSPDAAPPGTYRLDFLARDASGETALVERGEFVVYAQHRLPAGVSADDRSGPFSRELMTKDTRAFAGDEVNQNLTNLFGNQAETHAAVQPNNAARVIAAVNPDDPGTSNPHAAISSDFMRPGTSVLRTMPDSTLMPTDEGGGTSSLDICCDPALAADDLGNLWFSALSTGSDSHIVINRIAAGTNTLQSSNTAIPRFTANDQDKNMLTIDDSPSSPKYGMLYMVWTENPGQNVVISQCQTRPGGVSNPANCDNPDNWSEPQLVTGSSSTYTYSSVATAPNGDVYVTWWDAGAGAGHNAIERDRCQALDNCTLGPAWNEEGTIQNLDEFNDDGDPALEPLPFFCPIIAAPGGRVGAISYVDVGPDGRVYVAYSDLRDNGTTRCTASGSDKTFESFIARGATPNAFPAANTGVRLSDDGPTALNDHFFPTLTVDDSTNEVQTNLYSTKHDPTGQATHQYYVRSTDSGASYAAMQQITTEQTDYSVPFSDGFDYGDYEGADSAQGQFFPSWSDGRVSHGGDMELYMHTRPAAPSGGGAAGGAAGGAGAGAGAVAPPDLPPEVTLFFSRSYRIAVVRRRGMRGRARCNEACTISFRLLMARRTARRLGIVSQGRRPVTIGRGRLALASAGTGRVTVRLTRKAKSRLRRARRVSVFLRATATDVARNSRTAPTKRITLRR
jgi:hypothetical protein